MASHYPNGDDDLLEYDDLEDMADPVMHDLEDDDQDDVQTTPQVILSEAREQGPYKWSVSRIWISYEYLQLPVPLDMEARVSSAFWSIATPACVDLRTIKMPLTALELLLHVNNWDLQDRFHQNNLKAAFQAAIINWSRDLQIPNFFRASFVKGIIQQRRRHDEYDLDTPCTDYTVSHYRFAPTNLEEDQYPINYPLMDVTLGVHPEKWPAMNSIDEGPFTKAVRLAFSSGSKNVWLSQVDAFAAQNGIDGCLHPDYSDRDFCERERGFFQRKRKEMKYELTRRGYTYAERDL